MGVNMERIEDMKQAISVEIEGTLLKRLSKIKEGYEIEKSNSHYLLKLQ